MYKNCQRVLRMACLVGALFSASSFMATANASEKIGDWSVECEKIKGQCVAHQLVLFQNKSVLGVMVSYVKGEPAPHVIFRTTPNANFDKGAAIRIDDNSILKIPFSTCDKSICEIRSLIPKGLLHQMITGENLQFAFFVEEKQFIYPVSLNGFSETLEQLSLNQ